MLLERKEIPSNITEGTPITIDVTNQTMTGLYQDNPYVLGDHDTLSFSGYLSSFYISIPANKKMIMKTSEDITGSASIFRHNGVGVDFTYIGIPYEETEYDEESYSYSYNMGVTIYSEEGGILLIDDMTETGSITFVISDLVKSDMTAIQIRSNLVPDYPMDITGYVSPTIGSINQDTTAMMPYRKVTTIAPDVDYNKFTLTPTENYVCIRIYSYAMVKLIVSNYQYTAIYRIGTTVVALIHVADLGDTFSAIVAPKDNETPTDLDFSMYYITEQQYIDGVNSLTPDITDILLGRLGNNNIRTFISSGTLTKSEFNANVVDSLSDNEIGLILNPESKQIQLTAGGAIGDLFSSTPPTVIDNTESTDIGNMRSYEDYDRTKIITVDILDTADLSSVVSGEEVAYFKVEATFTNIRYTDGMTALMFDDTFHLKCTVGSNGGEKYIVMSPTGDIPNYIRVTIPTGFGGDGGTKNIIHFDNPVGSISDGSILANVKLTPFYTVSDLKPNFTYSISSDYDRTMFF